MPVAAAAVARRVDSRRLQPARVRRPFRESAAAGVAAVRSPRRRRRPNRRAEAAAAGAADAAGAAAAAPTAGPRPERPSAAHRMRARGEGDLAAVLAGAGLENVAVTPELARSFGQILRVVVGGVMDILQARQRIKSEFRMGMTTFKPADNNPLKFSANVDDALHNLLVKRNAAYLGPVEAFEDAFDDVRNHQMAMLAGVRVAFEAMLAEFDPERLQEEFDRQLKKGRAAVGARRSCATGTCTATRFMIWSTTPTQAFANCSEMSSRRRTKSSCRRLKAQGRADKG